MLTVPVRKDIAEYQSKIIGKLTARTLVTIVVSIALSVVIGAYFYFVLGLGWNVTQWAVIVVAFIAWAVGLYKPMGFAMEEFLPLWVQHNLTDDVCLYTSSLYEQGFEEDGVKPDVNKLTDAYRKQRTLNGIETIDYTDVENTDECN